MGTDSSNGTTSVGVQWETGDDAPIAPPVRDQNSTQSKLAAIAVILFVGGLIFAGRRSTDDLTSLAPQAPELTPTSTSTTMPSATTRASARGTRAFAQFNGEVLGVGVGASVVSTDFDGRLFALDLDTGILTRSRIRTGNFVTVAGRLVAQNGCGGWDVIDIPSFATVAELIDCSGDYGPIDQLGAEALLFAETAPGPNHDVLVDDGEGGLARIQLGDDRPSSVVTVSAGRVLIERSADEMVWFDPATNTVESYATGRLLAAGPGGVLWSNSCDSNGRCLVQFGTPDDAQIHVFVVEPFDLDLPARINPHGSRAVFFKADGVLRIVTTETGHAREVANPGISPTTATWSPDGLWLLETSGINIIALNTLNGRVVEFEGVPGAVSPGWIALPVTG